MKIVWYLAIFLFFYYMGHHKAQSQVTISSTNGQSDNYDEIEIDGVKCRNGLTSPTQLEFGIAQQEEETLFNDGVINQNNNGRAVAYGKITYSFGTPKRLDCSRLYELHIELLQEQLRKMQQQ